MPRDTLASQCKQRAEGYRNVDKRHPQGSVWLIGKDCALLFTLNSGLICFCIADVYFYPLVVVSTLFVIALLIIVFMVYKLRRKLQTTPRFTV